MTDPTKIVQGSPEWMEYRVGRCTGSRVKDALALLKNGFPSKARQNYLVELLCERLTGFAADHFVTPAMLWGIENERYARGAYEVATGNEVDTVGIIPHPSIEDFLMSPDGMCGDDGGVEFKAPNTATHIGWMLEDRIPDEHRPQLLAFLSCSGRKWIDFCSFDPRLPMQHQLFIKRLERNEEEIEAMEDGVAYFLRSVKETMEVLDKRNPAPKRKETTATPLPRKESWAEQLDAMADVLAGTIED